jgi:hypothetical protein
MNVSPSIPTGAEALTAPSGIPRQRRSDAFTAYASVHQLGVALQRAHADEGATLHPSA